MEICSTNLNELEGILKIYESARQYMSDNGNPNQWGDSYPDENLVRRDIENDHHFVCMDGNRLVGCFAFIEGDDPTYNEIIQGKWLNDNSYAVIHRIAVHKHGRGIGSICIEWCFSRHNNIRADTHKDNVSMQRLLIKKGFQYCGVIHNSWGDERLAFQRV